MAKGTLPSKLISAMLSYLGFKSKIAPQVPYELCRSRLYMIHSKNKEEKKAKVLLI